MPGPNLNPKDSYVQELRNQHQMRADLRILPPVALAAAADAAATVQRQGSSLPAPNLDPKDSYVQELRHQQQMRADVRVLSPVAITAVALAAAAAAVAVRPFHARGAAADVPALAAADVAFAAAARAAATGAAPVRGHTPGVLQG